MRCCCIERAKPLNTDVRTVLETKEQRKKDVLCERVAAFVFTFIGVMLLGIGMISTVSVSVIRFFMAFFTRKII